MKTYKRFILTTVLTVLFTAVLSAQNPIIRDQFTADPTARVFNGKVYLFPSHDIRAPEEFKRKDWFCMEDYHVFSSSDLTEWTDHGVIVTQKNVNWVDPATFSMWAPDCIERNGKYYFYFPANVKAGHGKGFGIGVAVADRPEGPYTPQPEPIKGIVGIDPSVFIDKDGQAFIYYSMNRLFGAKLKENMLELDSEPKVLGDFPTKGLVEGPFFFERNGVYYMTYPHVEKNTERLEYAISDNPLGPFKVTGVIMDESESGCWTNHHSFIEYKNQWYIFYHDKDLSPNFDKNRSARIDSLFFNPDGTIQKVKPTLRGVGLTSALKIIEIDRYSNKSETGVSVAFLDTANTFKGWKTIIDKQNSWIQYNDVDFGKKKAKTVSAMISAREGGTVQIRLNNNLGPVISEIKVPAGGGWNTVKAKVSKSKKGVQNLVVTSINNNPVEIDWISFK